ncbi:MAG: hypothetical protein A2138_14280 [Deltaproteobacteria bacterium RBG_16_71_12]|nr:MAG: hypothetical protein A2138_14280 [Deltaproteobacteria bacterium RBG_16_71_12]
MHRSRLLPLAFLPATLLLQAERCGPAAGLHPAFLPGTVIADDSLIGTWVTVSAEPSKKKPGTFPRTTIKREDTADGPSYLLVVGDESPTSELRDVRLRLFLFDVQGKRYADLVAEDLSKTGKLAKGMSVPQHLYLRVRRTPADGVALDYLEAEQVDAELARDPGSLPTVELVRGYSKAQDGELQSSKETLLTADAPTLQRLIARAAANEDAWSLALELTKKDAPALCFSLTITSTGVAGAPTEKFDVVGTRVEHSTPARKAVGVVTNPAELAALLKAFYRAAPSRPKVPLKKGAPATSACVEVMKGKPRCVERAEGDTSGADAAALETLRDAVRALVVTPP